MKQEVQTETLVMLDPGVILADDNSRYNLKPMRVNSLAANILETNGVLTPIEVEELKPKQGKFTHKLTAGFYRHAAVEKLNKEQQAGLSLPSRVVSTSDELMRLRHQVSENLERENMSPMDQAISADRLLKAGIPRPEIRRIFSRPGGRKGISMQPLSNAMLNILLRFLELPKAIQEKIHDGRVGVAAAYELGKVPPERRQAVLERAEADRLAQIDKEEKDEEKYLLAEKKLADAQSKEKEALSKIDQVKSDIEKTEALVKERTAALREIQKAPGYLEMDGAGKKAVTEQMNAATADVKAAEKIAKDTKNTLARLLKQSKTAAEVAEEQKAKLEAARKAVKSGKKGNKTTVGPSDVIKAAQSTGAKTGYVPLSLSDIRQSVKDVASNKEYPRVAVIAQLFKECFDGMHTPKQLTDRLSLVTGERAKQTPISPAAK